jgi:hypothetical protein
MKKYVYPTKLPKPLVFSVARMKVLGNYCSFEAFPLFRDGTSMGTDYIMDIAFQFCLAKSHGKWRVVYDLSSSDVPEGERLKLMRRDFSKDSPLALLPEFWREKLNGWRGAN